MIVTTGSALTMAGEAGVAGLGAPHRAAVEEGHGGVREHGGVTTRDQATLGRRACPLPGAVTQSVIGVKLESRPLIC